MPNITLKVTPIDHNPHMDDSQRMDHWRCNLRNADTGRRMALTFSKGMGHNSAEPTVSEVMECLCSDAHIADNSPTCEDFCRELGYDTDSRKAEKSYRQLVRQNASFRRFLGGAYDATVYPEDADRCQGNLARPEMPTPKPDTSPANIARVLREAALCAEVLALHERHESQIFAAQKTALTCHALADAILRAFPGLTPND